MTALFFDTASTTRLCDEAARLLLTYSQEEFGNPSSAHSLGQRAAQALREARLFFGELFRTPPEGIVFTGSGTEADNLAILGITHSEALRKKRSACPARPRILVSATEHPAVRNAAESLPGDVFDVQLIPVHRNGQIDLDRFAELLTPETELVSIQQVNNITGALHAVEELASFAKERVPQLVFHTDAVQACGKALLPRAGGAVDLVSISAHKIEGPKGVGALAILNPALLHPERIRPLVFGGGQEHGLRAGTQSPALIAAFHAAATVILPLQEQTRAHCEALARHLRKRLEEKTLLSPDATQPGLLRWNSPETAVPHIINLSAPGFPSGPLQRMLDERGCLVSPGSACSSQKNEPDPVLEAMGLPHEEQTSAIRISLSRFHTISDIDRLTTALHESLNQMTLLLGIKPRKNRRTP